jgi:transcriptional regulator with XRE-family HTH domain
MNDRSDRISKLLSNQKSRVSYIKAKLGVLVPAQIRAVRLKSNNPPMPYQRDLAHEAGVHQSRISMFETPGMSNMTLETLAKVAAGLRVGVIVKLVPFNEMLRWENSFSLDTFDVNPRLENDLQFLNPEAQPQAVAARWVQPPPLGGLGDAEQFPAAGKKPPLSSQEGMKGIDQPQIEAAENSEKEELLVAGGIR